MVELDKELLARVDERTQRIEQDLHGMRNDLSSRYVTKDQFAPVRNIVYGGTGLILITVVGALIAQVVVK